MKGTASGGEYGGTGVEGVRSGTNPDDLMKILRILHSDEGLPSASPTS